MRHWESWDFALWAVAGYLAIALLTRLMLRRRSELVDEVRQQLETGRNRPGGAKQPDNQSRERHAA